MMRMVIIMVGGEGELSYRVAVEKKINQSLVFPKKSQEIPCLIVLIQIL